MICARYCVYTGPSMAPTLRDGDLLEMVACSAGNLRVGDIIAFTSPGDDRLAVHRVISTSVGEIRTRGDGNDRPDSGLLEGVVGRVVAAWRGGVRHRIDGGVAGRAWIAALPLLRQAAKMLRSDRVAVRALAATWLRRTHLRIVAFCAPGGRRQRVLAGRLIVAERTPGAERWRIRFPFRLVLDNAALTAAVSAPLS